MKSVLIIIFTIALFSCEEKGIGISKKKICGCANTMLILADQMEGIDESDSVSKMKILDANRKKLVLCERLDDGLNPEEKLELQKILMSCSASKKFNKKYSN